jgi:hypothetical protein
MNYSGQYELINYLSNMLVQIPIFYGDHYLTKIMNEI